MRIEARATGIAAIFVGMIGTCVLAQGPASADAKAKVARVQGEIKRANLNAQVVGKRLPALEKRIEELAWKVRTIKKPKVIPPPKTKPMEIPAEATMEIGGPGNPSASPPKKTKGKELEFVPPFASRSSKKTNLGIVCENGKIYLLDIKGLDVPLKKRFDEFKASGSNKKTYGSSSLAGGDFNIKSVTMIRDVYRSGNLIYTSIIPEIEMVRKPGAAGLTLEQFKDSRSTFQEQLGALDPDKNIIQFIVYPSGYDAFQASRKIVLDRKFTYGWFPESVGKPIIIGGGSATGQN